MDYKCYFSVGILLMVFWFLSLLVWLQSNCYPYQLIFQCWFPVLFGQVYTCFIWCLLTLVFAPFFVPVVFVIPTHFSCIWLSGFLLGLTCVFWLWFLSSGLYRFRSLGFCDSDLLLLSFILLLTKRNTFYMCFNRLKCDLLTNI